jgi:MoxR-like ATPase
MAVPTENLISDISALGDKLTAARTSIGKRIIGQPVVVDLALTALLSGGHALLVGVPGLAKTRLVQTLGTVMGLSTNRIQFTPDLMPGDILGSEVLESAADGSRAFRFIKGPVFCQLLMADEINRASPRTQSALLQAHKTRSSRKAPILCPRPSLTGFCYRSTLITLIARPNAKSCCQQPARMRRLPNLCLRRMI